MSHVILCDYSKARFIIFCPAFSNINILILCPVIFLIHSFCFLISWTLMKMIQKGQPVIPVSGRSFPNTFASTYYFVVSRQTFTYRKTINSFIHDLASFLITSVRFRSGPHSNFPRRLTEQTNNVRETLNACIRKWNAFSTQYTLIHFVNNNATHWTTLVLFALNEYVYNSLINETKDVCLIISKLSHNTWHK